MQKVNECRLLLTVLKATLQFLSNTYYLWPLNTRFRAYKWNATDPCFRDECIKPGGPSTSIRHQKYPLITSPPQLPPVQKGWEKLFNEVSWDSVNIYLMLWCNAWLHQCWSNLHTGTRTLLAAFPSSHGCFAVVHPKTSICIWLCKEEGSVLASPGGAVWLPLRPSKQPQGLDWAFQHQENRTMGLLWNSISLTSCMRHDRSWQPLLPPQRWRALFLGVQKTSLKSVPKRDLASLASEKCMLFPDGSWHIKSIRNYNLTESSTIPVKAHFGVWGSHTEFISVFRPVLSTRSQLIQGVFFQLAKLNLWQKKPLKPMLWV